MSVPKNHQRLSVAEYLEAEKDSPIRHEYVDGQIFPMAGASDRHNLKKYVIVSQDRVHVEIFRRGRGARWSWELLTEPSEDLRLESVGLPLTVADVYLRVKLPQRTGHR